MRKILLVLVCSLLLSCAAGNRYNYRVQTATLPLKPTEQRALVLAVEDMRPYVLNGEKTPDFVGLQRGGYGNQFDVTTASGKPLTEDMAVSIASSLDYSGYKVVVADTKPDLATLTQLAQDKNIDRVVWLKVRNWKSDIYMSIGLKYDLHLAVYDAAGNLLGENAMSGDEAVGGGKLSDEKNSHHMAQEFGKRIGYLFNGKSIRDAL